MIEFTGYKIYQSAAGSGYARPEAAAVFTFTADSLQYNGDIAAFEAFIGDVRVAIIPRAAVDAVVPTKDRQMFTQYGRTYAR